MVTMADVAFEATGRTLEELFTSAAQAMTNTQLEDLAQLKTGTKKEFTLKAEGLERLLHDFLQELIFYKDAELLLFRDYELKVTKTRDGYELKASLRGEEIDPKRHSLLVDVKAVSWHRFRLEKDEGVWKAVVIIDV
jgi:SHS2 domain-containing protein